MIEPCSPTSQETECGACRPCEMRRQLRALPGFLEALERSVREIEAGRFVTRTELTRRFEIAEDG